MQGAEAGEDEGAVAAGAVGAAEVVEKLVPVEEEALARNLRFRGRNRNLPAGRSRQAGVEAVDALHNQDPAEEAAVIARNQRNVRAAEEEIGHLAREAAAEVRDDRALTAEAEIVRRSDPTIGPVVRIHARMSPTIGQTVRTIDRRTARVAVTTISSACPVGAVEADPATIARVGTVQAATIVLEGTIAPAGAGCVRASFLPIGRAPEEEARNGGQEKIVRVAAAAPAFCRIVRVLEAVANNGAPAVVAGIGSLTVLEAAEQARSGPIAGPIIDLNVRRVPSVRRSGRTFRTRATTNGTSGSRTTP